MNQPLAEKLRPQSFTEIFGQEHLTSPSGFITKLINHNHPLSILLWGPPGSGKTTIARLYAKAFKSEFISFSAIYNGVGDLKKIITRIKERPLLSSKTILFVDEIHRFNKAQQDAFLPFLEDGTIIIIGATTENPSFSLNDALLSRLRVLEIKSLSKQALFQILLRFQENCGSLKLSKPAESALINEARGDGRHLVNMLENLHTFASSSPIDLKDLAQILQKRPPPYDRLGDHHYQLISALHKSIRGSDPDAALYYLARMLLGGEDPQYILRRLTRIAMEDIGLADPEALKLAITAWETYQKLGAKEGELALAEVTVYLSLAPKSNALYLAFNRAKELAENSPHLSPPLHSINASNSFMKKQGFGKGYQYDHDENCGVSAQNHFPDEMKRASFYKPVNRGFEREMLKRLNYFEKKRGHSSEGDSA